MNFTNLPSAFAICPDRSSRRGFHRRSAIALILDRTTLKIAIHFKVSLLLLKINDTISLISVTNPRYWKRELLITIKRDAESSRKEEYSYRWHLSKCQSSNVERFTSRPKFGHCLSSRELTIVKFIAGQIFHGNSRYRSYLPRWTRPVHDRLRSTDELTALNRMGMAKRAGQPVNPYAMKIAKFTRDTCKHVPV